jgi:hypothetical protein
MPRPVMRRLIFSVMIFASSGSTKIAAPLIFRSAATYKPDAMEITVDGKKFTVDGEISLFSHKNLLSMVKFANFAHRQ